MSASPTSVPTASATSSCSAVFWCGPASSGSTATVSSPATEMQRTELSAASQVEAGMEASLATAATTASSSSVLLLPSSRLRTKTSSTSVPS